MSSSSDDASSASEDFLERELSSTLLENFYSGDVFIKLFGDRRIAITDSITTNLNIFDNDAIIFNVNALTGEFAKNSANHWVALIVDGGNNTVFYVDPMGRNIPDEISRFVVDQLGGLGDVKIVYNENNHPQKHKIDPSGSIQVIEGNDKDCGPMVTEALIHFFSARNKNNALETLRKTSGQIKNVEASKNHGKNLRELHHQVLIPGKKTAFCRLGGGGSVPEKGTRKF